jgi:hypothetical protein
VLRGGELWWLYLPEPFEAGFCKDHRFPRIVLICRLSVGQPSGEGLSQLIVSAHAKAGNEGASGEEAVVEHEHPPPGADRYLKRSPLGRNDDVVVRGHR